MSSTSAPYTPPSFGQPGVSITYQPKFILVASSSSSGVASSDEHGQASSPSQSTSAQEHRCPPITLAVPPAALHHIFAHRQWRAGMLMSDALVSDAFPIQDRSVLELGAGTGLPSITACLVGTSKIVVASDYDEPNLLKALRSNVRLNVPSSSSKIIKVVGHIWGQNVEELLDVLARGVDRFDTVLLADCMWDPLSHTDLLKTLVAVLAETPEARIHVIAGLHTGRDKITGFIRKAARHGFSLLPIESPASWPTLPRLVDDPIEDTDQLTLTLSEDLNDALAKAGERILELEVCGNTTIETSATADGTAPLNTPEDRQDDIPRLTGNRRRFLAEGYGEQIEGEVSKRNRWLTVWSLGWKKFHAS